MKKWFVLLVLMCGLSLVAFGDSETEITWISTQLEPIVEAEWVRNVLLPPFTEETGIEVTFIGSELTPFILHIMAEWEAREGVLGVLGGLYGCLEPVMPALKDLSEKLAEIKALGDRTFTPAFLELGIENGVQFTIPWMQATYLLVINRKALDYVPEGVDIWALSYDELLAWSRNIYEATGERKLGIPAGPGGLLHRFVHGYLYPSFTGFQIVKFDSPAAVGMWEFMIELWGYVHPAAPVWSHMDTPLLAEEVWIAWDHTARMKHAIVERPDDFIAIPSPAGPVGRGAITILAGLSIPKTSPNPAAAASLIEYLTRPATQIAILEGVGFFPVVEEAVGAIPPGPLAILAEGVIAQAAAPDLIVSFIPGGLGVRAGEAWKVFRDTFYAIVLRGEPIIEVLLEQGLILREIYLDTMAPFAPPGG